MNVCSYDSRGCTSFEEALNNFEHPELAASRYKEWSEFNSIEAQLWAELKLNDMQNREKLAIICHELGWRAAEECVVHSQESNIDIKPKTTQIYRPNQPATAVHQHGRRAYIDETITFTDNDMRDLKDLIDSETPAQELTTTTRELEPAA